MISPRGFGQYWETLRHLKPTQFYGRLWFRLARPQVDSRAAPSLRTRAADAWVAPARRRPSLLGPTTFDFLNASRDLDPDGWENAEASKLWLYNLHYFDDLNAHGADGRREWHSALIARWIEQNRPGSGTGWEPYPTSLRIVNWVKAARGGLDLQQAAIDSLAVQVRWLGRRLEHHLLGNHLFANAKALVFAGCFFEGPEAENWLSLGMRILAREIPEQILSDGGQFELSTMYHALALEDLLDLVNILQSSGRTVPAEWRGRLATMQAWLSVMSHPDGEIAFFNDAAIGIAPSPAELEAYSSRLGLPAGEKAAEPIQHLKASGYVRLNVGGASAWLDLARIGPDYLPGHAHADTLSFELAINGRRALVNSGTSVYGDGVERQRQRGTAAHNTVAINGRDSSEVWAGFRVARRARPVAGIVTDGEMLSATGSHDGYRWLPGSPRHSRRWDMASGRLEVVDQVTGRHERAEAFFHFHPDLRSAAGAEPSAGVAFAEGGLCLHWRVKKGRGRIECSTWHPEFGVTIPAQCLVIELVDGESQVEFNWTNT